MWTLLPCNGRRSTRRPERDSEFRICVAAARLTPGLSSEEQPAFFHTYEYLRGNKLGVIKLNPAIAEKLAKDSVRETLHPRHLPMLVKPKQWISADDGGYIYNKSEYDVLATDIRV